MLGSRLNVYSNNGTACKNVPYLFTHIVPLKNGYSAMQWITGHFHLIKLLLNTITLDTTFVFSAAMAQYCNGSVSFYLLITGLSFRFTLSLATGRLNDEQTKQSVKVKA